MITKDKLIKLGVSKIIAYNRKSRSDGNEEETLSKHKEILEEFLIPLGIPYEIMSEIGSSESLDDRIILPDMLELFEDYESQAIVYVEQSRLSRDVADVKTLFRFFKLHNITVIDLKNRRIVDFDNDSQSDTTFFESISDELYIRQVKRVLIRGRKHSAKKGNSLIKRMYGLERNQITKKMDIVEAEAEAIKLMYQMCFEGYGTKLIANKINELGYRSINNNEFTYKQIWKILKSECYKGYSVWNKQSWDKVNGKWKVRNNTVDKILKVEGAWNAIIEPMFWDEVNNIIENRSNNLAKKDMASSYWATGLFHCNVCGRKLTVFKKKNSLYVRGCQKTDLTTGLRVCNNSGGVITNMETFLIEDLKKYKEKVILFIQNYSHEKRDDSAIINQIKHCNSNILDTQKKIDSLMDLLESGTYTIDMFTSRMEGHQTTIIDMKCKLSILKNQLDNSDPLEDAKIIIEKLDKIIIGLESNELDDGERNRLWRLQIEEIKWHKQGRGAEEECEVIYYKWNNM